MQGRGHRDNSRGRRPPRPQPAMLSCEWLDLDERDTLGDHAIICINDHQVCHLYQDRAPRMIVWQAEAVEVGAPDCRPRACDLDLTQWLTQ
eukprot:3492510-Pyramimonas_sp.AAC.1